ncbi:MAG: hypothetical protein E6G57_15745 [Actinobacteria bacterium]|nr:MAG: hypothetical protein E6G57_15745 [Actinomycetota bacterium]
MSAHGSQDFDEARRNVGLSQDDLWMRYFGLGGSAMPVEFEAYVVGALAPGQGDHDMLVQALNERSMELGTSRRWLYWDEP